MTTDLADRVRDATAAAEAAGLRVAVSVRDLDTEVHHTFGDPGVFGTASVVKVMIAARLLTDGELTRGPTGDPTGETAGVTAALAWAMVTASDDDAANQLWARTGRDGLEPWVERHYDLPDLGGPNLIPGRWGNTHVTAAGLTALYGALRADPVVWPWLSAALHAITPVAADGTDQVFGLRAVDPGAAVKQGWANGSSDEPGNAIVHSTGVLAGDRLAVAILTEGHGNVGESDDRGFHAGQADRVTQIARALLS